MAPTARFTEQAKPLAVGEGLWKTMTEGPTSFKIYVPDPVSGQIGAIAMVKSEGQPTRDRPAPQGRQRTHHRSGASARTHHRTRTTRQLDHGAAGSSVCGPREDRLPREVLLLFAHGYYDAIEQSDGNAVPFADDCVRRENGMQTAGPRPAGVPSAAPPGAGRAGTAGPGSRRRRGTAGGRGAGGGGLPGATGPAQLCGPQLTTRVMSYIDSLDLRRVWIADPVNGLVFGLSMFRHTMTNKTYPVLNPDGTKRRSDDELRPVRSRRRAHHQGAGEQDSRHRSHGLHAAAPLEKRLERLLEIAPKSAERTR